MLLSAQLLNILVVYSLLDVVQFIKITSNFEFRALKLDVILVLDVT